jgi:esterase/lipase superfamily enzyme
LGDNPANPGARYSHERGDTTAGSGAVTYGTCTVSIPKRHVAGGLEDRSWWQWTTGQARTPDQHVMVMTLKGQQPAVFFSDLSTVVARSNKKDAFVFVHGFAVSFTDAARRTAQMAYDLRFEGAPIFFSWPTPELTTAPLTAYTTSEGNAELSKHRLRAFLQDVIEKTEASTVHIIAHSMGNRLVTEALQMLDSVSTAHLKSRIGEVVLTAPDIDTAIFNEIIAPRLTKFASRVTLYASTKDRAIGASEGAHDNPRIGDFQTLLTVPQGIEVIDASNVDVGGLGHSYYGDSEAVMADICYMLSLGERAAKRALTLTGSTTPGGAPCWSVVNRPLTEVYAAIVARTTAPAATS